LARWALCVNEGGSCAVPEWITFLARHIWGDEKQHTHEIIVTSYLIVAFVLMGLAMVLRPNANSLHPLYRDRLGKTFLFQSQPIMTQQQELEPLDLKLSHLSGQFGPYLASVMAISGAAASSSMGTQSIKPLTPTLAILNVRLGYWLRNPKRLKNFRYWNRWGKLLLHHGVVGVTHRR
jgi:hypothetical protein